VKKKGGGIGNRGEGIRFEREAATLVRRGEESATLGCRSSPFSSGGSTHRCHGSVSESQAPGVGTTRTKNTMQRRAPATQLLFAARTGSVHEACVKKCPLVGRPLLGKAATFMWTRLPRKKGPVKEKNVGSVSLLPT